MSGSSAIGAMKETVGVNGSGKKLPMLPESRSVLVHSVRCMHAVIGKFTNLHFGILNKSEILGLKGIKVVPYCKFYLNIDPRALAAL